jgi:transposase-like protein
MWGRNERYCVGAIFLIGVVGMKLTAIFEPDERYQTHQIADIFDVSKQTIRRWAQDDKIPYRETGGGREFIGHELMREIENSEFLRKRLRKAHGADKADEYMAELEDTLKQMKDENDRLREKNEELREEKEKMSKQTVELLHKVMDEQKAMREEMNNRLPEPEEPENNSKSWFAKLLPSFS